MTKKALIVTILGLAFFIALILMSPLRHSIGFFVGGGAWQFSEPPATQPTRTDSQGSDVPQQNAQDDDILTIRITKGQRRTAESN